MSKFEYLKLADTVAAEIADGTLKPGDRLPPQRSFAYERKIAVSTASRVYAELLRRGLVVGEVGRGTFISGEARRGMAAAGGHLASACHRLFPPRRCRPASNTRISTFIAPRTMFLLHRVLYRIILITSTRLHR